MHLQFTVHFRTFVRHKPSLLIELNQLQSRFTWQKTKVPVAMRQMPVINFVEMSIKRLISTSRIHQKGIVQS